MDVGANVGMFVLRACLAARDADLEPGATKRPLTRIFAFEPARESFESLARNVARNDGLVRQVRERTV